MNKIFLALLLITISTAPTLAATAYWTGQMRHVTTITSRMGVSCEYNYAGRTFWRTFSSASCPSSINVQ